MHTGYERVFVPPIHCIHGRHVICNFMKLQACIDIPEVDLCIFGGEMCYTKYTGVSLTIASHRKHPQRHIKSHIQYLNAVAWSNRHLTLMKLLVFINIPDVATAQPSPGHDDVVLLVARVSCTVCVTRWK